MAHRDVTTLFRSPLVEVATVSCHAHRGPASETELSRRAHVVLPCRGVFSVDRGTGAVSVDANVVLLLGDDDEYTVSHPADGGDECLVVAGDRSLLDDALGEQPGGVALLRAGDQLAVRLARASLAAAQGVVGDDVATRLLGRLASRFSAAPVPLPVGRVHRRRIDEARAALAADPAAAWTLASLAALTACSPFHLARQFRAVTGETVGRYVLRLRLAEALERLADGEDRLARLAVELGFSHHSHFSSRFRALLGVSPAQARRLLTRSRAAEMRRIVTAPARGPSLP